MEKKIAVIQKLRDELMAFSDATNNTQYRDKSDLEQNIEELVSALYFHLDKFARQCQSGDCTPPNEAIEDRMAAKMLSVANSLRNRKIPVVNEVADEFMQALELFDLAREAKEKGKTVALKDKYSQI